MMCRETSSCQEAPAHIQYILIFSSQLRLNLSIDFDIPLTWKVPGIVALAEEGAFNV